MDSSWGSSYTVYFREDKSRCLLRNTKFLKVSILDKGLGLNGVNSIFHPISVAAAPPNIFLRNSPNNYGRQGGFDLNMKSGHNPISVQLENAWKGKTLEQEEVAVPGFCDTSKENLLFLMKPPALPDESVIQPNLSYLIEAKLPSCCKHISHIFGSTRLFMKYEHCIVLARCQFKLCENLILMKLLSRVLADSIVVTRLRG